MPVIQDVKDLDLLGLFVNLTDAQIQNALDHALCFVEESSWSHCADEAIALLAAHYLADALAGGGMGVGGPVTSESAGGLSRSFGMLQGKFLNSSFASTSFGRRFLELRSIQIFSPLVIP
jgi:hypothetical protein